MAAKKDRFEHRNKSLLPVGGILLVILLAVLLLWTGNLTSHQAMAAIPAGVRFQGEYSIAGGRWQPILFSCRALFGKNGSRLFLLCKNSSIIKARIR